MNTAQNALRALLAALLVIASVGLLASPAAASVTISGTHPTTDYNTPVSGTITFSPDSYSATVVGPSEEVGGTITAHSFTPSTFSTEPITANYTFTPTPGFVGTASFTYWALSSRGSEYFHTETVTVYEPGNGGPTYSGDLSVTVTSGPSQGSFTINVSDPEGDATSFVDFGAPARGYVSRTVSDDSFVFSYGTYDEWYGQDEFSISYTDGENVTKQWVTVNVVRYNDPPIAYDRALSTVEDTPATGSFYAIDGTPNPDWDPTDPSSPMRFDDGEVLSYALAAPPAHGTVTLNGADLFTYAPDDDWHGTDTFTYVANDGSTNSNAATVTVTVTPASDAPVAASGAVTGAEDTDITGVVSGTDGDGDPLRYSLGTGTAHGAVSIDPDGTYTYVPETDFHGTDSFTFVANDGTTASLPGTMTVTVTNVNDVPVPDSSSSNVDAGISSDGVVTGTDADGDTLAYVLTDSVDHGTITFRPDGTYTYTADAAFSGTDTFAFQVHDGTEISATTATVTLSVNGAPVADDATLPLAEDASADIDIAALVTDPDHTDGDLTISVITPPAQGTLTYDAATSTATFTGGADWSGTTSFTYQACDPNGLCAPGLVTVTVTAVNDAPVAEDGSVVGVEDTDTTGTVTGTDIDGDTLAFELGSDAVHGTVTVKADGTFTYVPDADFNGIDSFTITARDGNGASSTATVSVTVDPVNDAPVAADDTVTTTRDTATAGTIAVADVDDSTFTFALAVPASYGTATVDAGTGEWAYTPIDRRARTDTFTVQVCDAGGLCDSAVVTLTATPPPGSPTKRPPHATPPK